MNQNRKRPRWIWITAGLIIMALSVVFCIFLLLVIVGPDRYIRIVVPGQATVTLPGKGAYTIYYEYQTIVNGKAYRYQPPQSRLNLAIEKTKDGSVVFQKENLDLSLPASSMRARYNLKGRSGVALTEFSTREGGEFRIRTEYGSGLFEPQVVLAIAPYSQKMMMVYIISTVILMIVGIFLGVYTMGRAWRPVGDETGGTNSYIENHFSNYMATSSGPPQFEEETRFSTLALLLTRGGFFLPGVIMLFGLPLFTDVIEKSKADPGGLVGFLLSMTLPGALLTALGLLFWTPRLGTTINVDGVSLRFCSFRPRRIAFREIADAIARRHPWGKLGYHIDPFFTRMVRYDFSASHEVEITLRDGKRIIASTNRPEELLSALSAGMKKEQRD